MSVALPLDIIGGYAKSEFPEFNPEETVNLYVESLMGQKALFPSPGLNLQTKITVDSGGRALYFFKDTVFAVIKDGIYRIDSGLHASFVGEIDTETGHVGIADNGTQLIFVDGVGGWIFDTATDNFTSISSPNFPSSPESVAVLGGRFYVNFGGTEKVGFSAINDGTSWDALDFFSMEPYPDIVVALATLNGRLFVMGKKSTITYYESGNPDLPVRKDAPAHEFGCAAVGSVVQAFGVLGWLARTENGVSSVVLTTGGNPTSVTSESINTEIESYSDVTDCSSYIYKNENGNIFYVMNFTTANASWGFHINSELDLNIRWSRLINKKRDRQIANAHVYYNGKHYVLGYNDGNLYEYSTRFLSDNGTAILRRRVTKAIYPKNLDRFIISQIIINLKQGTGLEDTTGVQGDPKIFLSVSKDNGVSYGNVMEGDIGKIGRGDWRTEFYRLGYFDKGLVLKIEHFNKTPLMILGASMIGSSE